MKMYIPTKTLINEPSMSSGVLFIEFREIKDYSWLFVIFFLSYYRNSAFTHQTALGLLDLGARTQTPVTEE